MSTPAQTDANQIEGAGVTPTIASRPSDADQEIDVWWGSYSGWTMIPSLLVCIFLTGLIAWFTWVTFRSGRSGVLQLTFLGMAGSVWLFQALRWAYRSFSYNYRLTTRRLFRDRGFGTSRRDVVALSSIADVRVRAAFHEKLVGVGRVVVLFDDKTRRPLVLAGVRQPRFAAELIRTYSQRLDSV